MTSLDTKSIAAHVVVALAEAQAEGRTVRLDQLAEDIGVEKADVRTVVTQLDGEGHVDAMRLRLTMTGLALAASLANATLRGVGTATAAVRVQRVA